MTRPRRRRESGLRRNWPASGEYILWPCKPGRDYGTELEILHGLQGGEEVVVDPGDAVKEGALVQTVASNSAKQTLNTKPGNK